MTIDRLENGNELKLVLHGQVDTQTAPIFEEKIKDISSFQRLSIDFSDVPYVSSAGLRVLLVARKAIKNKENIVLTGVNPEVLSVLDITGFVDILTIKE